MHISEEVEEVKKGARVLPTTAQGAASEFLRPNGVKLLIMSGKNGHILSEPKPWERQPAETEKAYTAFRAYLDLGPERTLEAVGQKLGKSTTLLEKWSSRWKWVERVRAYGSHMFRQTDLMREREARSSIITWREPLEELSKIIRANPDDLHKLRYADKIKALELLGKHHRLWTDDFLAPASGGKRPTLKTISRL